MAYRFSDTVNCNGVWNPVAILDDRKARQAVWTPQAQVPVAGMAILFLRPDSEAIELELTRLPNGKFRLSDMRDTRDYLYVNGLNLTQTLLDKAREIAKGYGVSVHGHG